MKFNKLKDYISFDNIVAFILVVGLLIALLFSFIVIPIRVIRSIDNHRCITFEDGTEYHVKCVVSYDVENIIFKNRDGKLSIPIKDRSYIITDCDCDNAVSNIEEIKEIYNENLH